VTNPANPGRTPPPSQPIRRALAAQRVSRKAATGTFLEVPAVNDHRRDVVAERRIRDLRKLALEEVELLQQELVGVVPPQPRAGETPPKRFPARPQR
jgi:hypothetical protein